MHNLSIEHVKSIDELDAVLGFVSRIFGPIEGQGKYSRQFWIEKMNELPELLLYAIDGDQVVGSVFAWVDNNSVTVAHCAVAEDCRGRGIGLALMQEIEGRVKSLGYRGLALGSVEGAEGFYERLGFKGSLLIQSEHHSIEELLALNTKYEVLYTNIYEGTVNQVCLRVPAADRELQRKYEATFPGCTTQMVFGKRF